ncbi:MAG: RNA polymerase sigma-70 factor [Porphyromonas sp.]|nr:RNA polymerase sigma-70 factor [Porphyromonas sp.]
MEIKFEKFYTEYHPILLRFARRYIADQSVAENVVHDLFVKLWEKPELLDGVRSPANYLLTMCRNACIDQLRQDYAIALHSHLSDGEKWLLEERLQALYQMEELSPYDEDVFVQLEQSIAQLPARCQEILRLYRFQGLSYQEIADQLEISPRTVEAQLRIAMQKLREMMPSSLLLLLFAIR